MLTIIDVPEKLLDLYKQSKVPLPRIVQAMMNPPSSTAIDAGADLMARFPDHVIYVRNGILKHYCRGRFIRFYSTGDMLSVPKEAVLPTTVVSEFGADVFAIPYPDFQKRMQESETLLSLWVAWQKANDEIMHELCSVYIPDEFTPNFELRQYEDGAIIIQEGDEATHLFEMLEGKARVTANGKEIGVVDEGEVFGEISFLTASPRSATVTATAKCLVRLVRGEDFEKFSRFRPALLYKMSRTLATRLTEVNRRLVAISSIT